MDFGRLRITDCGLRILGQDFRKESVIRNPQFVIQIFTSETGSGDLVRMEGLEPPRLTTPDPKSGAATNYATCALRGAKVTVFRCKKPLFFQ